MNNSHNEPRKRRLPWHLCTLFSVIAMFLAIISKAEIHPIITENQKCWMTRTTPFVETN